MHSLLWILNVTHRVDFNGYLSGHTGQSLAIAMKCTGSYWASLDTLISLKIHTHQYVSDPLEYHTNPTQTIR